MLISVKGLGSQHWGWFGLTSTATQCWGEQGKGKQMDGGQQLHKSMPDLSTTSSLTPLLHISLFCFLPSALFHFPFNFTIPSTLPPSSLHLPSTFLPPSRHLPSTSSILHVCHLILHFHLPSTLTPSYIPPPLRRPPLTLESRKLSSTVHPFRGCSSTVSLVPIVTTSGDHNEQG